MSSLHCKSTRTSVIPKKPCCTKISPEISFAKYVFIYPDWLKGDFNLFPGDSQYNNFMRTLCHVLKDSTD